MTTVPVQDLITNPTGTPLPNNPVEFRLVTAATGEAAGYVTATSASVLDVVAKTSSASGLVTAALEPNLNITPASSYYEERIWQPHRGLWVVNNISVPVWQAFTAAGATLTATAHGMSNGDRVQIITTGALPAGLVAGTNYYVVGVTTNTFGLALTSGGAAIVTTTAGTGTHSVGKYWVYDLLTTVPAGSALSSALPQALVAGSSGVPGTSTGGAHADHGHPHGTAMLPDGVHLASSSQLVGGVATPVYYVGSLAGAAAGQGVYFDPVANRNRAFGPSAYVPLEGFSSSVNVPVGPNDNTRVPIFTWKPPAAQLLQVGRVIRCRITGVLSCSAGSQVITFGLQNGSALVASQAWTMPSAFTNTPFIIEGEFIFTAIGAGGTFDSTIWGNVTGASTPFLGPPHKQQSNYDTTLASLAILGMSAQYTAATGNNQLTVETMSLWIEQ